MFIAPHFWDEYITQMKLVVLKLDLGFPALLSVANYNSSNASFAVKILMKFINVLILSKVLLLRDDLNLCE